LTDESILVTTHAMMAPPLSVVEATTEIDEPIRPWPATSARWTAARAVNSLFLSLSGTVNAFQAASRDGHL
jgi:hypothetical protein